MSTTTVKQTSTSSKIWQRLLLGLLIIQAILELGVGGTLLFSLPTALETGFGIPYTEDLEVLGNALGLYLLFLTTLLLLSTFWTFKRNNAGITLAIIIGIFLLTFGVVSTVRFGGMQAMLVDGLRGLLTIIIAYMAGKELKN